MKTWKTIISQSNTMEVREQTAVYGSKRMFSAASFFDVIEAKAPDRGGRNIALREPTEVPSHPAIVAFYGLRGGAGRTLALAHVAIMLAQRGLRIAAVDFDLEAPGLQVALGTDPPIEGKGLVPLLQKTLTAQPEDPVNVVEHLQVVSPKEGTGKILLLPAGRVTRHYLAQIEELGVGLWHEPSRSPLERILASLKQENPDVVCIDCRTGFNGMSASVLFHHADLAVIFLPLTDQVWDGIEMLFQAVAAARTRRDKKPGLLFVPSMVPSREPGREKVKRYLARLSESYDKWLPPGPVEQAEDEAEILEDEPWLREGIVWDARLSSDGSVRQPFRPGGPWGLFQPLCDNIVAALDLGLPQRVVEPVQARAILDELQIGGSIGFAEDLSEEQMQRIMVPSDSVKASVDRASALIVGAKGSGKTLLWRYLVEKKRDDVVRLPSDTKYVVGHAPKFDLDPQKMDLSADAFKELEQAARMRKTSTYKAFWLLYGLFRLSRAREEIAEWLPPHMPSPLPVTWRKFCAAGYPPDFAPLLYPLWGRTIEKGKKAYTANYILKRTSDAQGRLFPRTFIQMLDKAVKCEKEQDQRSEPDRVLRFRSLRAGVIEASKRRAEDLRTEYVELKPYLELLRGAPAVASAEKLKAFMKRNIGKPEFRLHLGAGGWSKVLNQLITVGVLARKPGEAGEDEKLSAALVYRDGLEMKSAGLK